MKPFAFLAVLALVSSSAAFASEPSPEDRAAIQTTISSQIEAFRRDDGAGAFAVAADPIQQMFGTPDAFLDMVKRGYAPVYRPKSVVFGALAETDAGLMQDVLISDSAGEDWIASYLLARGTDGRWRVAGCTLKKNQNGAI